MRSSQKSLTCICIGHVVNLCVKVAVEVLPLKVDDLYYHFYHSVKQVASLVEYADFVLQNIRVSLSIVKHVGYS